MTHEQLQQIRAIVYDAYCEGDTEAEWMLAVIDAELAAPQDQDAKLDEIRKTLKIGMNIGKALRESINEDTAKDAERYRWLRDHASNDWLDSGITDDAVDEAINDKSQWRKKP